jgi:hypothetical protein
VRVVPRVSTGISVLQGIGLDKAVRALEVAMEVSAATAVHLISKVGAQAVRYNFATTAKLLIPVYAAALAAAGTVAAVLS